MPLNAHGLLKRVDQKVYVQMTYETGQRLQGLSRDKGRKWENK